MPATSVARAPLIMAFAAGVGETLDEVNGNPHAGVLFQRSSTVGLLLNVTPPGEGFSEQFVFLVGIADVGVVPAKVIILHRVSHLHETAYVTPPCASKEQGNILRKLEVAILRGRLRRFRGRVRRVEHY